MSDDENSQDDSINESETKKLKLEEIEGNNQLISIYEFIFINLVNYVLRK